jgi:hypothetical protein
MNSIRRTFVISILLWASIPLAAMEASSDEAVMKLRAIVPEEPAVATAEHVKIMAEAGATKRLDAAYLLIRALAFNFEPGSSNELRSLVEMMPAATILKRQYGSQVLPLLMTEAVGTEKKWLQKRIALVLKTLDDQPKVASVVEAFSLKTSTHPKARQLASLLEQDQIDVELANPALESANEFIEELKKKNKPPRD